VKQRDDQDDQPLTDDTSQRWEPVWRDAWAAEADRRFARMMSGEDRSLTLAEFWSDEDDPS